jgi:hypothetical protein
MLLCRKRLAKMISTMRERLSAKLGNNNDNAFKMRKLFKMYDRKEVGMVSTAMISHLARHEVRHSCADHQHASAAVPMLSSAQLA